jgi:hypothetical protein
MQKISKADLDRFAPDDMADYDAYGPTAAQRTKAMLEAADMWSETYSGDQLFLIESAVTSDSLVKERADLMMLTNGDKYRVKFDWKEDAKRGDPFLDALKTFTKLELAELRERVKNSLGVRRTV